MKITCCFVVCSPKNVVMGTPMASASLYKVLTEGDVFPRSIMLSAFADKLLAVASERMDIFRSSRNWRKRVPTSTEYASLS
jgi:hypothetical protein